MTCGRLFADLSFVVSIYIGMEKEGERDGLCIIVTSPDLSHATWKSLCLPLYVLWTCVLSEAKRYIRIFPSIYNSKTIKLHLLYNYVTMVILC